MPNKPPLQVVFKWDNGDKFLECFEDAELATIDCELASDASISVGDLFSVVLRFEDRNTDFQLHATLLERDDKRVKFQFLAEERLRLEMVLVSARGESLPYRRRRHTRIPLQCQATLTLAGEPPRTGTTFNLGAGGLQVQLDEPFEPEITVAVLLALPEGVNLDLVGRVSGRIDAGPERGNSIEFLFRSPAERNDLASEVEAILARARDKQ